MKLLKQHNIPMLGAVIDSFVTSLPLISIYTAISVLIILYTTSVQPVAEKHIPWLSLPVFISGIVFSIVFSMVFVFKFILPSVWTFRQRQMFGYESEVIDKLNDLDKKLDGIDDRLKKIEAQNDKAK